MEGGGGGAWGTANGFVFFFLSPKAIKVASLMVSFLRFSVN